MVCDLPLVANSTLNTFSVRPFPAFSVAPGLVTSNGSALETILGGYYRLWLTKENLLTGNDSADAAFVYFRANVLEKTTKVTAQAFAAGMLPAARVNVNLYQQGSDPVFDPVGAGVALLDQRMAIGFSPSGDVTADVVYANYGRPEDFKKLKELGVETKGKIAIVRYGANFRGVKPFVASENGCVGVS